MHNFKFKRRRTRGPPAGPAASAASDPVTVPVAGTRQSAVVVARGRQGGQAASARGRRRGARGRPGRGPGTPSRTGTGRTANRGPVEPELRLVKPLNPGSQNWLDQPPPALPGHGPVVTWRFKFAASTDFKSIMCDPRAPAATQFQLEPELI